jgi:hypothetical protein
MSEIVIGLGGPGIISVLFLLQSEYLFIYSAAAPQTLRKQFKYSEVCTFDQRETGLPTTETTELGLLYHISS